MTKTHQSRLAAVLAIAMIVSLMVVIPATPARPQPTELFISEYVEGTSNNKAIEIYNGTGAAVDLAGYQIQMFFNGNPSAGLTIDLTGNVADGDVFVLAHSSADASILAEADQTNGAGWFNGNDAVALIRDGSPIDVIGQIGTDPGEWGTGDTSTMDNTLRRKTAIEAGDPDGSDSFDPSVEWDGFPTNTFDGLGSHGEVTPTEDPLFLSEYIEGSSFNKAIEIFNGSGSTVDLSTYTLELYSNGSATASQSATLSGSLADGEVYVLAHPSADAAILAVADVTNGSVINFNGDDALVLRNDGAVADSFGQVGVDPGSEWPGGGQNDTLRRKAEVTSGDTNPDDPFDTSVEWDTFGQDTFDGLGSHGDTPPPPPIGVCGDPASFIHDIQGSGPTSPLVGDTVIIEGVVVNDLQNNGQPDNGELNGFNVQEENSDIDADPATSEGIFVFSPGGDDVAVGDAVRLGGAVSEFNGLTEITLDGLVICSSDNTLPDPGGVTLPVDNPSVFEAFEGMRVTFAQDLTISEFFNFDRFGEIVLTDGRLYQPTAVAEPRSPEAAAVADLNARSRITLDDGRGSQNPDPAIHPNGDEFDLDNLFRGGDLVTNVTGTMDFAFGLYRIQPTQGADYTPANPRPADHDDVGSELEVAAFNVLNYFTTIDSGVFICGPAENLECRGADNAEELERQRAKIVTALVEMDSDVVGLIEIENNPGDVPTADLVSGLNAEVDAGTYEFIETGGIGTDAIRQALIYKPASVEPVGDFAILDSSVDPRFDSSRSRPVLAQTFRDLETGEVFTVAVNHLKSKGSACGPGDDDPQQGNCNGSRTSAAEAMVDWLAGDPTGSGDDDFLIIGDLNAYDKEDPIDVLVNGGYTDLVAEFGGEEAYSYVFDGQLGYLDHALANPSMADQVTGTTVWHINTDEADLIDYDTTFKLPAQDAIYAPDQYRSSDHDPVIVGLGLCDAIPPEIEVSVDPDILWPPNHKYRVVNATVLATDDSDDNPTVELVSVTSNEPDNGPDDGNTINDIVVVDDDTFQLRAERSGSGTGRVYTITYQVTDDCGNTAMASATVSVPLSPGD